MTEVKSSKKINVAILGSGNIGMDLMIKIMRTSKVLEVAAVVGIDEKSDGIQRAERMNIATSHQGLDGLVDMAIWQEIDIVFDATSAGAHQHHHAICQRDSKQMIDLTPAAIGPYCIPVVNLEKHLSEMNVNMVTCGGQATIPIVHAIKRVSERVPYAEIVASISSKSAGPGTRANIDEFTETTSRGIEQVGGAEKGKAIIVLNPAEPPMLMRDTIYAFAMGSSKEKISASVADMAKEIQSYVPGYRLKQAVQFEEFTIDNPLKIPELGEFIGLKCSVFVEVEGAAHYLPAYAGNLDIMTSAGLTTAERIAVLKFGAIV